MKRLIALGTVIFKPDDALFARLDLALDEGFEWFFFDNSPEDPRVREYCCSHPNCRYFTCGKNVGLGIALSNITAQAYFNGYRGMLFFDQDTVFNENTVLFVDRFFTDNPALAENHAAIVFNAKSSSEPHPADRAPLRQVLMAISSGSLFFLENLKRIGWHNPSYFVDCVDYELCLRAANHGLLIQEFSATPGFDHLTGQPDQRYRILGRDCYLRKYSPQRIADTVSASLRLFSSSVFSLNATFAFATMRSLTIYLGAQALARLLLLFNVQPLVVK